MSWLDRLRGGFKKTADKVADNLTGLTTRAALDTATLDDIEEAPKRRIGSARRSPASGLTSSMSAGSARSLPSRSNRSWPRSPSR